MDKLKFKEDKIKEALERFKKITPNEKQQLIIDELIDIGLKYLDLKKNALALFVYDAIIEWEKHEHKNLLDIREAEPDERIKMVSEILSIVKERLINILVIFNQKDLVDKAFDEAFKYYKNKFANE